jgi:hypothetical protein
VYLPDGTMIQSGSGSCVVGQSGQMFVLPFPFPNALIAAVASPGSVIPTNTGTTVGLDASNVLLRVTCEQDNNPTGSIGFRWMAMGY